MKLTIRYKRAIDPETGDLAEREVYFADRVEVTKEEWDRLHAEQTPQVDLEAHHILPNNSRARSYPYASDAMGVHPDEVPQARELDKRRGSPSTEYTPSGQPIFTSGAHRAAYLKAHKYHDRNSYYGH